MYNMRPGKMQSTAMLEKLVGVRLDEKSLSELDKAAARLGHDRSEALREAIGLYLEKALGMEVIYIRNIAKAKAKEEIRDYINKKGRAWLGDIADELRIDYELVARCVEELEREKAVEEVKK